VYKTHTHFLSNSSFTYHPFLFVLKFNDTIQSKSLKSTCGMWANTWRQKQGTASEMLWFYNQTMDKVWKNNFTHSKWMFCKKFPHQNSICIQCLLHPTNIPSLLHFTVLILIRDLYKSWSLSYFTLLGACIPPSTLFTNTCNEWRWLSFGILCCVVRLTFQRCLPSPSSGRNSIQFLSDYKAHHPMFATLRPEMSPVINAVPSKQETLFHIHIKK
jgi:hypothetical protein